MSRDVLDTVCRVETPEGIELEAQLAGPIPRILAYLIDLFIRSIILALFFIVSLFFDRMGMGIFLLLSFLMEWFYPVFFEVFRNGQTPGKRSMNLAVVNEDLTPIAWGGSLIRNLLRSADFLPFAYLFGLTSMALSNKFQRLGDMAAGSIVIHQKPVSEVATLPDIEPQMAPVFLEIEDQIALISYVQRHHQLTKARQEELAAILNVLTQRNTTSSVNYLHGIGAWLLGAR